MSDEEVIDDWEAEADEDIEKEREETERRKKNEALLSASTHSKRKAEGSATASGNRGEHSYLDVKAIEERNAKEQVLDLFMDVEGIASSRGSSASPKVGRPSVGSSTHSKEQDDQASAALMAVGGSIISRPYFDIADFRSVKGLLSFSRDLCSAIKKSEMDGKTLGLFATELFGTIFALKLDAVARANFLKKLEVERAKKQDFEQQSQVDIPAAQRALSLLEQKYEDISNTSLIREIDESLNKLLAKCRKRRAEVIDRKALLKFIQEGKSCCRENSDDDTEDDEVVGLRYPRIRRVGNIMSKLNVSLLCCLDDDEDVDQQELCEVHSDLALDSKQKVMKVRNAIQERMQASRVASNGWYQHGLLVLPVLIPKIDNAEIQRLHQVFADMNNCNKKASKDAGAKELNSSVSNAMEQYNMKFGDDQEEEEEEEYYDEDDYYD